MDIGVLVGALVLDQVVDIHAYFAGLCLIVVDTYHHPRGIDIIHHTTPGGGDHGAGVHCRNPFNAGPNKGFFRPQNRYRLALHVGAHQRPVGVVMLQKWHQRCGYRDNLGRGDIHVLDPLCPHQNGFASLARRDQLAG